MSRFNSKSYYASFQWRVIDETFINPKTIGTYRGRNKATRLIGGGKSAEQRRIAEELLKNNTAVLQRAQLETLTACANVIRSEAISEDIAAHLLHALTSARNLKYNDYSGNLRRSYFVAIDGADPHLFVAKKNVAAKPSGDPPVSNYISGFYYLKRTGHPPKDKMPKYRYGTGKNYNVKRKPSKYQHRRYVKNLGKNPKYARVEAPWSLEPHQYIDKAIQRKQVLDAGDIKTVLRVNKDLFKRNSRQLSANIVVGNFTPYRRFVEARGYDVINSRNKSKWEKKIVDTYGRHLNIALSQVGYNISKKRYMTARENADMNSNNTGYKKYIYDPVTNKYKWVFDKLY